VNQIEYGLQVHQLPFQVSRKYINEDYYGQDYNRMIGEIARINLPIGATHTVSDWFTLNPIGPDGKPMKGKSSRSTGNNPYAATPQYIPITKKGVTLNVKPGTWEVTDDTGKVYEGPNADKVKAQAFGKHMNKNMEKPYDTDWGYYDPKTDKFIEKPSRLVVSLGASSTSPSKKELNKNEPSTIEERIIIKTSNNGGYQAFGFDPSKGGDKNNTRAMRFWRTRTDTRDLRNPKTGNSVQNDTANVYIPLKDGTSVITYFQDKNGRTFGRRDGTGINVWRHLTPEEVKEIQEGLLNNEFGTFEEMAKFVDKVLHKELPSTATRSSTELKDKAKKAGPEESEQDILSILLDWAERRLPYKDAVSKLKGTDYVKETKGSKTLGVSDRIDFTSRVEKRLGEYVKSKYPFLEVKEVTMKTGVSLYGGDMKLLVITDAEGNEYGSPSNLLRSLANNPNGNTAAAIKKLSSSQTGTQPIETPAQLEDKAKKAQGTRSFTVIKPYYHSSMKSQIGDKKFNWDYYTESDKETRQTKEGKLILGTRMTGTLQPAINYAVEAGILSSEYKIPSADTSIENSNKVRNAVRVLKELGINTPQELIEYVEQHEGNVITAQTTATQSIQERETPAQLEDKAKKAGLLGNKVRQALWQVLSPEQQATIANKKGPKQKQWMDALEGAFNATTNTFDEAKLKGTVDEFLGRKALYSRTDEHKEPYKRWNKERELQWLRKALPNLSTSDHLTLVNGLIRINDSSKPGFAYGKFQSGMITISELAARGTAYHEAFHAVVHTLLNEKEYQKLFDVASERWSNITDPLELEEKLAEDFRMFMQSEEEWYDNLESKNYGTIRKTLAKLFHKLKNFINRLSGKTPYINKLYYNINRGKFARRKVGKSDATRFSKESYTSEMQSIKDKAIANGTFMKAPNGKDTNLTERQWLQVRTKAFKDWFGDWEKYAPKSDATERLLSKLNNIANSDSKYAALAKLILDNKALPYNLKYFKIDNNRNDIEGHAAMWHSMVNLIEVLGNNVSEEEVNKALLHELIHYNTEELLTAYKNSPENVPQNIRQNVTELYSIIDYAKKYITEHFNEKKFREIAERQNKNIGSRVFYAFDNQGSVEIDEFISEIFTNPGLQEILNSIPYKETNQTLWDKIKECIHDIFGIPVNKGSVLEGALKASTEFITKAKKEYDSVSKVVDENGEPLVVYHGTPNKFTIFERNRNPEDEGVYGKGLYFSNWKTYASDYGNNLMPVFLNIRNPKEMMDDDFSNYGKEILGNDGVIANLDRWDVGAREYAVPNPNQIKSATDNIGTFDPNNPDIRFRYDDEVRDLERDIEATDEYIKSIRDLRGRTIKNKATKWITIRGKRYAQLSNKEYLYEYDAIMSVPSKYRDLVEPIESYGSYYLYLKPKEILDEKIKQLEESKEELKQELEELERNKENIISEEARQEQEEAYYRRIEQYHVDKRMYDNLSQDDKEYLTERGITPTEYSQMTQLEQEVLFHCKY
jgi:hypothetical protein